MNEIFVFAQTRSGSTLLQRAINQTPGVTLYGEHGGMLHGFAAAYYGADLPCLAKHSSYTPERLKDLNAFVPCHSCITVGNLRGNMRDFIEATFNPAHAKRWGFKEVRYGRRHQHEDMRVFEMLVELFPTAKFPLLIRHPRDQIISQVSMGWSKPEAALDEWLRQFNFYCKLRRDYPDRCRLFEYWRLVDAQPIWDWLQLDCPVNRLFELPVTGATTKKSVDEKTLSIIEQHLEPHYHRQKYD